MRCFLAALPALVLALPSSALSGDLAIRTFVKPAGNRLHVLLRVSFQALNGVDLPSQGTNGELDVARTDAVLPSVARWWVAENIEVYEGDARLPKPQVVATRISLPSDNSFASYEEAWTHLMAAGLPNATQVFRDQAMLDVRLDYPIQSDRSHFAIHSMLARLGTHVSTDLRFLPPDGVARTFEYQGDPGLFSLDPRWRQVVQRFVPSGFLHILRGTDYLLFLFSAALLLRNFAALVPFVAAFAIAHSTTLIASAYNLASDALWFPPLIETLIAVSILYMAFENIAGGNLLARHRWMLAFGFGLIYGFGFSSALRQELQFAGSHVLTSVLSFNLGIEMGQVLVLGLLIPALNLALRLHTNQRVETIVLSALVADISWHRVTERAGQLSQFSFQWPSLTPALIASAMVWLTIFLGLGGVASLVLAVLRHRAGPKAPDPALSGTERPSAL
jgi:HupE/UreJ protein